MCTCLLHSLILSIVEVKSLFIDNTKYLYYNVNKTLAQRWKFITEITVHAVLTLPYLAYLMTSCEQDLPYLAYLLSFIEWAWFKYCTCKHNQLWQGSNLTVANLKGYHIGENVKITLNWIPCSFWPTIGVFFVNGTNFLIFLIFTLNIMHTTLLFRIPFDKANFIVLILLECFHLISLQKLLF